MHIIIGILGSIVTILYLLNRLQRLGIDFGWLNPFTWYRRRQWKQKVTKNPVYTLEKPIEAVAGLLYSAAKCSGDITQEHKKAILKIFTDEFELNDNDAIALLSSTNFLVKDEDDVANHLKKFLEPSFSQFSDEQKSKTLNYVETIIQIDDQPSAKQQSLLKNLNGFMKPDTQKSNW